MKTTMQVLKGDETFSGTGFSRTVSDFWRWAFGDLGDDGVRGAFAEWMVGLLLGMSDEDFRVVRRSGDNADLEMDGIKIEVKSAAHWQSWRLWMAPEAKKAGTNIRFGGLFRHVAAPSVNTAHPRALKSDLYVFCYHSEKREDCWNALDLAQWRFRVLTKAELEKIKKTRDAWTKDGKGYKTFSVSWNELEKSDSPVLAAEQLGTYARNLINKIRQEKGAAS